MFQAYPAAALDLGEPLGEMVDVRGRAVHLLQMGEGSPTVWLENGWLGTTLGWQPFQQSLAAHTRVCSYDRAGTGWSDPADSYRTAQNEADEFAALLDAMGESEPIILLAWSGGGPVAQIFAADHPERVAGLILMDAISPEYDLLATQTFPDRYPLDKQDGLEQVRRFAEKAGAGALQEKDIEAWVTPSTLERYGDRYLKLLLNSPSTWWTYYWQYQYIIASGAQVKSKSALGDIPLAVMVAMRQENENDAYQRELAQLWRDLQAPQAQLSRRGQLIRVDAGHAIFREQAQQVIDIVLDLIDSLHDQHADYHSTALPQRQGDAL